MSTLFKDQVVWETYGETIAVGDMLYKSTGTGNDSGRTAGRLYKLDTSNADRNSFYGIAKDSGNNGDTNRRVVTGGRFDGLSALTPGLPVYANPAVPGGVTQVRPSSNVQVIGVAIDADSISVNSALAGSFGAGEGSGGVGGVDILFVQDFETAALGDFTQTGLVLSTTNPLKGAVSARLVHQPAVNQSFRQTIPVAEKFRNRNITLKLNIKSAAPAGDVTITIRDVTNSVNLVTSEQLPASNAVGGAIGIVSFNVPATCTSLSYEIIALPEAGSPVTIIDDIVAELSIVSLLSTSVTVPVVTGWQGYTPTFQGFGTPTNIEFEWRRVGENVEVRGKFVSGTTTAVEARIGLPGGLTSAGTALIPSIQIVGSAGRSTALANFIKRFTILAEPSVTYLTVGLDDYTNAFGALNKVNGNSLVSATESFSFFASVPCAGLTANVTETIGLAQSVLVEEADSVLVARGNAGQAITANVTNIPFNLTSLTGDAFSWNGSQLTVLNSGILSFKGFVTFTVAASRAVEVYVNGSIRARVGSEGGFSSSQLSIEYQESFLVGDTISFRVAGANGTLSNVTDAHYLIATYQGSLKQINVNPNQKITIPTSELRMEGASTRGSTATAIVRFDNIAKIRGDAFEVLSDATLGTRIVMKKKGKITLSATMQAGSVVTTFMITKNMTTLTNISNTPAAELMALTTVDATGNRDTISTPLIDCQVGDIFRVAADGTASNSTYNRFEMFFQEQDISVSVTNTLPQFSESDSSVRVDTANGYGSTGTRIRRFSNVRDNIGNDIEYVPSAVNGDSFVVKSNGIYHISYTDNIAGSRGITKNASSLTTNVDNLTVQEVLASSAFTSLESVSWQGYLQAGDVIRGQTNAAVNVGYCAFTISKVGKPNVTGVDVTPFVNLAFDTGSIGEIKAFAGSVDSTSFLECDGSAVSRSRYADLFQRIGTSHGQGDGSTTFNLPDYRGRFLRGVDGTANRDPDKASRTAMNTGGNTGNNVGSVQSGANLAHTHVQYAANSGGSLGVRNGIIGSGSGTITVTNGFNTIDVGSPTIGNSGGNETRPVNAYVNYGIRFKAANEAIISPTESFSTDTALLQYAPSSLYTLATLNTAPVGTYITFTYAANTNTRTQTTTRPTQTDAGMNVNGIRIFTRAFNASSTAAEPAAIAIQIGKGLRGKSLSLFKSVGKVISGSLDHSAGSTVEYGAYLKNYDEKSGILTVDLGLKLNSTSTIHNLIYDDLVQQNNGYLVINASKSPALTGVPLLQPRIATLSHQLLTGNQGGTFTAGSFITRVLNTIEDPTGIVTSLASNQFTLPAGEYYIEAKAPAYYVTGHKARLRNITDGTDAIVGRNASAESSSGAGTITDAEVIGRLVITTPKTFELQHRCVTTRNNDGLGLPLGMGINEIYATVKITRVR